MLGIGHIWLILLLKEVTFLCSVSLLNPFYRWDLYPVLQQNSEGNLSSFLTWVHFPRHPHMYTIGVQCMLFHVDLSNKACTDQQVSCWFKCNIWKKILSLWCLICWVQSSSGNWVNLWVTSEELPDLGSLHDGTGCHAVAGCPFSPSPRFVHVCKAGLAS